MGTDMVDTDAIDATVDANLADTDMMDANAMNANVTDAMMDANAMNANVTDAMMDAMTDTHMMDANLTDVDMMDADTMEDVNTMDDDFTDTNTMDPNATASAIIIDQFPFSHPSTPIIGPHQTSASDWTSSMVTGDSLWSLFCSQIDWEVVHWAKTCSAMASAVTDLLAIPRVGTPLLLLFVVALMHRSRSLAGLGFHTGLQIN